MKRWYFTADYLVTRNVSIEAETVEEAKKLFDANDWEEDNDSDCVLQDADEPDWNNPDEDDSEDDE